MEQWHQFTLLFPLIILVFISLISPGPDFAITVKNSLAYSRKSGLLTALGIALGSLVHISYTLLGLGLFITKTPIILHIIQYLGAGYLFYIGLKNLGAKPNADQIGSYTTNNDLKPSEAFFNGFITNLLNPKAMLFLSVYFQCLCPEKSQSPPNYSWQLSSFYKHCYGFLLLHSVFLEKIRVRNFKELAIGLSVLQVSF